MDGMQPSFGLIDCTPSSAKAADFKKLTGPIDLRDALANALMEITVEEQERRVGYALTLGLPSLSLLRDIAPPGSRVLVCGGGPSIKSTLPRIRDAMAQGALIAAVNVTHDWLLDNDITPHFALMLDPAVRCAGYQRPTPGVRYLMGANVHFEVWRRFRDEGLRPFLFVPICTDTQHKTMTERYPEVDMLFVAGSTTVGLRAVSVMRYLGFQDIELHGFDSCYEPGATTLYAYQKPHIINDRRVITLKSKTTGAQFRCISNGAMSRQVLGFSSMIDQLNETETNGRLGGVRIILAGDGALPWMAWADGGSDCGMEHLTPDVMAEKYGASKHWDYSENKEFAG